MTSRSLSLLAVLAALPCATNAQDIGPGAVASAASVKTCEAQAASNSAAAHRCLADALRKAQPEAARFVERLQGDGYLREFLETGRVDVALVTYMFRGNTSSGLLLVNGTPSIVDVNDPANYKAIDIKKDPLYATLAKQGEVELWADDPAKPFPEATADGGQRFRFKLPIKSCRACEPVGVATVAFDFDRTGKFLGVRLIAVSAGKS